MIEDIKHYKPKSKKWFVDRIGKRIYRNSYYCCATCDDVAINGLIVIDDLHADCLASTESDFANEGVFLNYRNKK